MRSEDRTNHDPTYAVLAEKLDRIAEDVELILRLLNGNNGSPGIIVRLDRIEQKERRREWVVRAALTASVTALVGLILAALSKLGH